MSYYLAPSLAVLRSEINQRWPRRDKTSDGWIGDAAHQSTQSDHNPNARGSVNALDIDVDGVDVEEIKAAFQRHPSAHYWIHNRQIADRDDNWRRRTYTGSNPHTKHLHGSIRQTRAAEQDTRPWGLLEDDMDAAKFLELLKDPAVTAFFQVQPWKQKVGRTGRSTHDTLFADMAGHLAGIPAELAALRGVVEQLAAAIAQGGGSVDTAAILAGVDERIAQVRAQVADELASRLAS